MHFNVPRVVFKITAIDKPERKKNTCVSVWLLVRSSEADVPFHYAHMPLETDTRQKISETEVVHMYRHDENTEPRAH